jgi:hypothetical protein
MAITYTTTYLTGSYNGDKVFLLKVAENNALFRGRSSKGLSATLDTNASPNSLVMGYGYDLVANKSTALSDLAAAGATISNPNALQAALSSLSRSGGVSQATAQNIAGLVSLPNEQAATTLLQTALASREHSFDTFTQSVGLGVIPQSKQRVALMDLWYQGQMKYFGTSSSPSMLTRALIDGNRAEAWYEIRYNSAANGGGVIARRYVDAQMFRLFSNPNPSAAETIQAYQMLTTHRPSIISYEAKNGYDPDSSGPPVSGNSIDAANNINAATATYGLGGTIDAVQTLAATFAPAKQTILSMQASDSPLLSGLGSSETFQWAV